MKPNGIASTTARAALAVIVAALGRDAVAAEESVLLRRSHPTAMYWHETLFAEGGPVWVTLWDPVQLLRRHSLPYSFVFTCAGRERKDDATVATKVDSRGAVYLAASVQKRKAWDTFVAGIRAQALATTSETCGSFVRAFPSLFVAPDPPIEGGFQAPMCLKLEGRADDAVEARTARLRNGKTAIALTGTGQSRENCAELIAGLDEALHRSAPQLNRLDVREEIEETLSLRTEPRLDGRPVPWPPGAGSADAMLSLESLDGRAIFSRWTWRTRAFRLGSEPRTMSDETWILDVAHFFPEPADTVDFSGFALSVARTIDPSIEPPGVGLLARVLRERGADLGADSLAVFCDPAKPGEASACVSGSCAKVENAQEICAAVRTRLD